MTGASGPSLAALDAVYEQPRGAWAAGTYGTQDLVTYQGGVYRSKVDANTATPGTDATKWEQLAPQVPLIANGYYYPVAGVGAGTTAASGVGTLRVCPWIVRQTLHIVRLVGEITGAGEAGSLLRLGLWADDGTGYPGALSVDGGTIDGTSATVQEVTVDVTITPGIYYLGGAVQNVVTSQPTIRTANTWFPPIPIRAPNLAGLGLAAVGYSATGVTGAFGAFPAGAAGAGNAPRVGIKVAA